MDQAFQKALAQLDPAVRSALEDLDAAIAKHSVIADYQKIERQVLNNGHLTQLQDELKAVKKDIVTFQKIDKPKAAAAAKAKADQIEQALANDPLTIAYRQSLYEADEILEYITQRLETQLQTTMAEKDQ